MVRTPHIPKPGGFAALLLLLAASPAQAALDLQGTRSIAMGGGLRASATGESALLLNPAGMPLLKSYVLSGIYQFRVSDNASLVNASVVDSVTNKLSAGVFYSFRRATPTRTLGIGNGHIFDLEEKLTSHEAGLALAYPLADMFIIGVTAKYIYHEVEQPENTPDWAKGEENNGVSLDIGVIFRPWRTLHLAAVGYNVIPLDGHEYPIQMGLGISYTFSGTFLAEFDTVLDFTRDDAVAASFHGGAEIFAGKMVAIRVGAMHDMFRDATYVTGGLGLMIKKIGLDVGVRQMVDGGPETLLAFSIRAFLQ